MGEKKITLEPTVVGLDELRGRVPIQVAAHAAFVSVKTIRRMVARGDIAGYRLNGRNVYVDSDELRAQLRRIPTASAS